MSLKLYLRNGIWNYRGTIGPAERRSRLRGSCYTSDKDIAARQVAEIETNYWKGSFDGPGAILTFRHAAEMFCAAGRPERFLDRIKDHFKDTLVSDITGGAIREMAIKLYPNGTGATRNRQGIGPAQAVINFAAESDLCSPIRVKRFKVTSKVKEPVTLEWLYPFMANANPAIGSLSLFMFLTGARVGEALSVQWEDVSLNGCTVLIKQTKVSAERISHLPTKLVAALASLPRIDGRPVFVYQHPDDIVRAWFGTIKRAGIKRLTPHSCRHGFATGLLRKGVDVVTVAKLGGWKTPGQVLKTYGHAIDNRTLTDLLVDGKLTHADTKVAETLLKTGVI
jgi:integrase